MGMKTGLIRYNVRERGRRFRGQDRNFDTAALAALVNGPEVQEQVKQGDMLGYYGHWPRVKFGMNVQEGAMVGGKVVHLEPAIRTTSIRAFDDGTIEHEAEFLDTAPGRIAARMYQSKVGGFSSAINAPRRGSMQVPTGFFGFDWVTEPNYTANRGYALDSAGNPVDISDLPEDEQLVLDEAAQYTQLMEGTNAILDRVQAEFDQQAVVLTQLHEENVELQGEVAKKDARIAELQAALDSARQQIAEATAVPAAQQQAAEPEKQEPVAVEPVSSETLDAVGAVPAHSSRFARADEFENAKLAEFQTSEREDEPKTAADNYITRRWGV